MYKWNKERYEKIFNRIKNEAMNSHYRFNEEELSSTYLDRQTFTTKSPRIWRFITLAYYRGKLNGIRYVDNGYTPITLSLIEYSIKQVYSNYNEHLNGHGDIYDDINKLIKEHPNEKFIVGYYIIDELSKQRVNNTKDWYNSIQEAEEALSKL